MRRRVRRGVAVAATLATVVPACVVVPGVAPASAAVDPQNCQPGTTRPINQVPSGLTQLNAAYANRIATGKGVIVAVVDSGVDTKNTHFPPGSVLPGIDLTSGGPGTVDTYGHGTAVAGEIAARQVSGSGVIGLAPDATILPIRVYTTDNTSGTPQAGDVLPNSAYIAAGIRTAATDGAKIINVSMSTNVPTSELEQAVAYATSVGALVVASAGNRDTSDDKSNTPRYPGAYSDALAVSAVDATGVVTDDSIHGSYIDVAAPGTDILTAYLDNGDCLLAADQASTSYATAYVSAAAALVAQTYPNETPAQWRYRLEVTALRVRPDASDINAGWGIIRPYEALTFVSDGTAPGPPDPAVGAVATPSQLDGKIPAAVEVLPDHTTRDHTLWLTLAAVVVVLTLALVALWRRDRKRPARAAARDEAPKPPVGVG